MTSLPDVTAPGQVKLGLVIDLDTCVGCQACAVACKEWNTQGYHAPLTDLDPYGGDPLGVWLNRVHNYEFGGGGRSPDCSFPALMSPLRGCRLCDRVSDRRVVQAGGGWHRASQCRYMHRLQALLLGLSLWRARI